MIFVWFRRLVEVILLLISGIVVVQMCTTKGTSCVISVHPIKQSNLTKYQKQGSVQNKIEYFSARRLKCTRNKKRWTDGNVLCNLSAWETFPWRPARPIWVTTNFHVIGVTTMCKRFNRILVKISIIIWTSRNRNCCWVFNVEVLKSFLRVIGNVTSEQNLGHPMSIMSLPPHGRLKTQPQRTCFLCSIDRKDNTCSVSY